MFVADGSEHECQELGWCASTLLWFSIFESMWHILTDRPCGPYAVHDGVRNACSALDDGITAKCQFGFRVV